MDKITLAAVSYLNTKPFLAGIENSPVKESINIVKETPALCAELLQTGKADIGLIPVAEIPKIAHCKIITNYCIGCDGEVGSVGIFSDVPINEIKTVLLDYQSRTSVKLTKLLFQEYWKISPTFTTAKQGYEIEIKGTTAGLVIGDRAIAMKQNIGHYYDLGKAWKDFTGLPFVFATWVTNKKLPDDFINNFQKALAFGVANFQQLLSGLLEDEKIYLTKYIKYDFSENEKYALQHFLETVKKENL